MTFMKNLILTALLLLALAASAACKFNEDDAKAEEEAARTAKAMAAYQAAAEALSAAQENFFRPSPSESAFLTAGTAHNPLGTPNGYFTNQDGVSGYFQNYSRPFNFTWKGRTVAVQAFDGHTYQVIDGPGELTLKYAGDQLLLQRYKGEYKEGLWQGHGEFWSRNGETGGHNYMYYQGLFEHDRMTGRGALTSFNYGGMGQAPVRYEGEIMDGGPHGQGLATDLVTGEMMYKGLWLNGDRFPGGREAWRQRDQAAEMSRIDRQYMEVMMTDRLIIDGEINSKPGQGPLVAVFPESFGAVTVTDQTGRAYPAAVPAVPAAGAGPSLDKAMEKLKERAETGESSDDEGLPEKKERKAAQPDQRPRVTLDLPLEAYPLVLTISYDRPQGTRHFLRLTVKRPFEMIVYEDLPREGEAKADGAAPAEPEGKVESI